MPQQPTRTSGSYTARGSGDTSQYDPIKDSMRHKASNVHRGNPVGATSQPGTPRTVTSGQPGGSGPPSPAPALPKDGRDYEAPQGNTRTTR